MPGTSGTSSLPHSPLFRISKTVDVMERSAPDSLSSIANASSSDTDTSVSYNALRMELSVPWSCEPLADSESFSATANDSMRCKTSADDLPPRSNSSQPSVRSFMFEFSRKRLRPDQLSISNPPICSHSPPVASQSLKRQASLSPESNGPKTHRCFAPLSRSADAPTRGAKRPSSLPIPSQMRASRRTFGSSTEQNSPSSVSSVRTFPILIDRSVVGDSNSPKSYNFSPLEPGSTVATIPANEPPDTLSNTRGLPIEPLNVSPLPRPPQTASWTPLSPSEIGVHEPVWAPDNQYTACMSCQAKFTLVRRRHHCRACGRLLCATCCNDRIRLPFAGSLNSKSSSEPHSQLPTVPEEARMKMESAECARDWEESPVHPCYPRLLFPNRPARVCLPCYKLLAKDGKSGTRSSQPPSPKRQKSTSGQFSKESSHDITPSSLVHSVGYLSPKLHSSQSSIDEYSCDAGIIGPEEAYWKRVDKLLFSLPSEIDTSYMDNGRADLFVSAPSTDALPPLVISVHAELVLQHRPPLSLLCSLLDPGISSVDVSDRPSSESSGNSVEPFLTESGMIGPWLDDSSNESSNQSGIVRSSPHCVPFGITFAITRNVHVHVHSTELACCLKQPAWCFVSRGFRTMGQEEIVIVVRRRAGETLPPMEIYRTYQVIYLTLISRKSDVFDNRIVLDPFWVTGRDKVGSRFFRSYDCFTAPKVKNAPVFSPVNQSDESAAAQILLTSILGQQWAGLIFFHPTHQCLMGLHLPNPPFLFGVLFHELEAPWAHHFPLRLLLRLGKLSRYYPTPILSDWEREPVFDYNAGTSVLQLFTEEIPARELSDSTPRIFHRHHRNCLLRLDEMRIRLNYGGSRSPSTVTCLPLLEVILPADARDKLFDFLDNIPSDASAFVLVGGFDETTDSQLVAIQSNIGTHSVVGTPVDGSVTPIIGVRREFGCEHTNVAYTTQAISIADADRRVTGAVSVIFSLATAFQGVRIVEDGFFVQMPAVTFANLLAKLKLGENVDLEFTNNPQFVPTLAESVADIASVRWASTAADFLSPSTIISPESHQVSWVDTQCLPRTNTYLVPLQHQLAHWLQPNCFPASTLGGRNMYSFPYMIGEPQSSVSLVWARLHILSKPTVQVFSKQSGNPVDLGRLADDAARAMTQCLRPYVKELRHSNHTQIALRFCLQPPDQVGYQVSGLSSDPEVNAQPWLKCGPHLMNSAEQKQPMGNMDQFSAALDNQLLPVLHNWAKRIRCEWRSNSSLGLLHAALRRDDVNSSPILVLELDFYLLD